jgi:molybdate transport system substrate-binding protein
MSGRSFSRTERAARGVGLGLGLLAVAWPLGGCRKAPAPAPPLKVAAAADLSFAFKDLGEAYEKKTGHPVVFSFGATGLLEKQIAEGAPFDVFAAANVSYADDAVHAGACQADSKAIYATGHIVLYTAGDAGFAPATVAELTDPRVKRIAIANPGHAPYGKAAKEAMEHAGVWDAVQAKLVYGENVQQTLQFAQSGNADVAIVALSLATVTPGRSSPIPTEMHNPIEQAMVVCNAGKAGAAAGRDFVAFVQSPEGHAVMRRFGFLLPGEPVAATKP